MKISIIGTGLIGGSIAKGLKKNNPKIHLQGFDKTEVIQKAMKDGTIDTALKTIDDSVDSDIIFLCLPTELSLFVLEELGPNISPNTVISDVCGVKGIFAYKWKNMESKGVYVGGHPLTGKDKSGYDNSDADLFQNSIYTFTNLFEGDPRIDKLIETVDQLGARIKFMDPYLHDKIAACMSHLPQTIAVALLATANESEKGINFLDFASGGFTDITRIAATDFTAWDSLYRNNKRAIIPAIEQFQKNLNLVKHAIHNKEFQKLSEMFRNARNSRDLIPKNTKGFIRPLFDLFVEVNDELGVIAKITSVIAKKSINLKDIELLKARENMSGSLRLSFESEETMEKAKKYILKEGYTIY
jgi:prephenate dehydrogenase